MIKSITIKNVASYTNETKISDLTKVNFFFGSNGSGKTTITKIIANPDNYPDCKIEWSENQKIKVLIFNEEFVRENFYQTDKLKGIFTLGTKAKDIENNIKSKNEEINKLNEKSQRLDEDLKNKEEELSNLEESFKEKCWSLKQKYDEYFKDIFTGYRNSKENFKEKIIKEFEENKSEAKDLDYLKKRSEIVFKEDLQQLDLIKFDFDVNKLKDIENNEILKTKIIGKKDVDIAKIIEKLNNNDWVRQGKEYYDKNFNEEKNSYICPFCQQATSDNFRKQLEEYFDTTYQKNIEKLKDLKKQFDKIKNEIENSINNTILQRTDKYTEEKKQDIKRIYNVIQSKFQKNELEIINKIKNPSITIEVDSISNEIEEMVKIIEEINNEISNHNKIVQNLFAEKEKLKGEVWHFVINELKYDYQNYNKTKDNLSEVITSLKQQISTNGQRIKQLNDEISELEKERKSVKPTIDLINKLLKNFGFTNFFLKTSDDEKHYLIVRPNNENAKETLSEGERNFILFLYFYRLISGSMNENENINENKIVVIDDPVSSLDSNVLFIISTLIKDLLKDVRKNSSNIKQIFILTHNTYFFKQITFISSREVENEREDTNYYIIRKRQNVSEIQIHKKNPIKTYYQSLWLEIKNNNDTVSLQNAMRRILEYYFKILGGLKDADIISKFEDETEKEICRSLIAWINEGSHEVFDEINYIPDASVEQYKSVFKKIFELEGHLPHYEMMMKNNDGFIRIYSE